MEYVLNRIYHFCLTDDCKRKVYIDKSQFAYVGIPGNPHECRMDESHCIEMH